MSHTPGQWGADLRLPIPFDGEIGHSGSNIKRDGSLLEIVSEPVLSTIGYVSCELSTPSKEEYANARVIAAAPDLLEACKALHNYWKAYGVTDTLATTCLDLARNAIIKATGESTMSLADFISRLQQYPQHLRVCLEGDHGAHVYAKFPDGTNTIDCDNIELVNADNFYLMGVRWATLNDIKKMEKPDAN